VDFAPKLDPKTPVILQASERRFNTRVEILTAESEHFKSFFKHSWRESQPVGSYFVDIDGDTFKHILKYMHSGIFPVLYDKNKGHEFAVYLTILQQADYLISPALSKWLIDQTYLKAVKISRELEIYTHDEWVSAWESISKAGNVEYDFYPTWVSKKT